VSVSAGPMAPFLLARIKFDMRRFVTLRTWPLFAAMALLFFPPLAFNLCAQEPTPPPAQPAPPAQAAAPAAPAEAEKTPPARYSHANDFLVLGTVFDDKGYAFPNVQLRIRRASEKKFRWDSYTNSRGEFALRVPQGTDYELLVHVKGFSDQTRAMDAKSGISETRLVFRMEPAKDQKK
jgi:hypothetical protein